MSATIEGEGTNASNKSLTERYLDAISLVESSPEQCLAALESIQRDVHSLSLFSSNEIMEDISTKSIPFLALEHFMATAMVNLPAGPGKMAQRKSNILQSLTLLGQFLERLERLEVLSKEETKEFHDLLEEQQQYLSQQEGDATSSSNNTNDRLAAGPSRETKIARFKAKQQRQKEIERLEALRERRHRCGIAGEDEMDGHDQDSLERTLALAELDICKGDALENWLQSQRELPMIEMMVKMEGERQQMSRHSGGGSSSDHVGNNPMGMDPRRRPPPGKGLQVTHITKDNATGQLQCKRDEIRSKVFRPGWSQPTMSLEELGEREYQQAMEREERQKQAEANQMNQPRRYEELVRYGMEDNAELVEASAKLDRDWDDWKDQNPKGSGNKMANRGDKNF